jgi:hypothetical protein
MTEGMGMLSALARLALDAMPKANLSWLRVASSVKADFRSASLGVKYAMKTASLVDLKDAMFFSSRIDTIGSVERFMKETILGIRMISLR